MDSLESTCLFFNAVLRVSISLLFDLLRLHVQSWPTTPLYRFVWHRTSTIRPAPWLFLCYIATYFGFMCGHECTYLGETWAAQNPKNTRQTTHPHLSFLLTTHCAHSVGEVRGFLLRQCQDADLCRYSSESLLQSSSLPPRSVFLQAIRVRMASNHAPS